MPDPARIHKAVAISPGESSVELQTIDITLSDGRHHVIRADELIALVPDQPNRRGRVQVNSSPDDNPPFHRDAQSVSFPRGATPAYEVPADHPNPTRAFLELALFEESRRGRKDETQRRVSIDVSINGRDYPLRFATGLAYSDVGGALTEALAEWRSNHEKEGT